LATESSKVMVRNDRGEVLLVLREDLRLWVLPGGGCGPGETHEQAAVREVREETGYSIEVDDVLWVRDYIGASHAFAAYEPDVHQVEVMFSCSVDRSQARTEPMEVDAWQLSVDWIRLEDLPGLRLFPAALVPGLMSIAAGRIDNARYLGDVN